VGLEVGERVFVRRYRTWNGEPFDQNIGAILGTEGVVVVDTRGSHRLADELRDDLARLTRQSIAAVVNTHHHWDHTWGNARFAAAPIWGHVRCAERVATDSAAALDRILGEEPSLAEELGEVIVTPPDHTFADAATIDLGDRQVALRHIGHGHTDNDIVVTVPDASVLFAGDLLENDAPPSFGDAFPLAWAETAARLLDLVDGAVGPGHGSIGDGTFAGRQSAELAELAAVVRAVASGSIDRHEGLRRSPYPARPTEQALDRGARELEAVKA
jgi:glyoxylase-like metal-dependent hydrolase (beta-lactamase superfamily II)